MYDAAVAERWAGSCWSGRKIKHSVFDVAFAIFVAVKIFILIFLWVAFMLWSKRHSLYPEDGGSRFHESIGEHLQCYQDGHISSTGNPLGWHETDVSMYRVSWCVAEWHFSSSFLDLDTVWRLCGSLMFKPLHPWRRTPGIYWIGSWMGPAARFDAVEKREIFGLSVSRTPFRHLVA